MVKLGWFVGAFALAVGAAFWLRAPGKEAPKPAAAVAARPDVRVATPRRGQSTLLVVADAKGYFNAEGLAVELKPARNGGRALDALRKGEVDLAVAGDPAIAFSAFDGPGYAVLGTIAERDKHFTVLALKSSGIATGKDLRGKRVGVGQWASTDYQLHLYLERVGLTKSDFTSVALPAEKLPTLLASGELDAIAGVFQPRFISKLEMLPGIELTKLTEPALQHTYVNLVASKELIERKPEAVGKLMRALSKASDFVALHREETIRAVAQAEGAEGKTVERDFRHFKYGLSLDESLVRALETEGRWYQETHASPGAQAPSWAALIHADPLRAAKPEAVRLGK